MMTSMPPLTVKRFFFRGGGGNCGFKKKIDDTYEQYDIGRNHPRCWNKFTLLSRKLDLTMY